MILAEIWAITLFIDEITTFNNWASSYFVVLGHFAPFISIFIGAILLQQLIVALKPYLAAQLNEKVAMYLKSELYSKSTRLRLRTFEQEEYFNRLERSNGVLNRQLVRALEQAGTLLQASSQYIGIVIAVSQLGIGYSLLLLLSCAPIIYTNIKSNKQFNEVNYGQSATRRKQEYWQTLMTSRDAAAELRIFQLGTFVMRLWKRNTKTLVSELLQARKRLALINLKGQALYLIILFIMIGSTTYVGLQGAVSIGTVVATLYLLERLEGVMRGLIYPLSDLTLFYYRFQVLPEYVNVKHDEKKCQALQFLLL